MTTKKNDDKIYDLRTLDAFQARGVFKASDYEKHLKALPDEEGNYDLVLIEEDEEKLDSTEEAV